MTGNRPAKYLFCKCYLAITRFIISVSKANDIHLGTRVIYMGRECNVTGCNIILKGERVYKILDMRYQIPIYAKRTEIKKVHDLDNFIHDATSWWKWYKNNWLELDAKSMVRYNQLSSIKIIGRKKKLGKKYKFK